MYQFAFITSETLSQLLKIAYYVTITPGNNSLACFFHWPIIDISQGGGNMSKEDLFFL